MALQPLNQADRDLALEREHIRQRLAKINYAVMAILIIVIALCAIALGAAHISRGHYHQSLEASAASRAQLGKSYLAQASAERANNYLGSKARGLAALTNAAAIEKSAKTTQVATDLLARIDLGEPEVFWPNQAGTIGLEFDADLTRFVRRMEDGSCMVYAIQSNELLAHLPGKFIPAYHAVFSPNGKYLCVRYQGGSMAVWDIETEKVLFRFSTEKASEEGGGAIHFSPASTLLAAGDFPGNKIRFFEVPSGRELRPLTFQQVENFAFIGEQGNRIATFGRDQRECYIFDLETHEQLEKLTGLQNITSIAASSNGNRMAIADTAGNIIVTDLNTGGSLSIQAHASYTAVTMNKAGTRIASTAWDGVTKVWEANSGRLIVSTLTGLAKSFSNDGQKLAFTRGAGAGGIWPLHDAKVLQSFTCSGPGQRVIFDVDVSRDGQWIAAYREDGIHLLNASTGEDVFQKALGVHWAQGVRFHPTEDVIIASTRDGIFNLGFEVNSNQVALTFTNFVRAPKGFEAVSLKMTPDAKFVGTTLGWFHMMAFERANPTNRGYLTNFPGLRFALEPKGQLAAISSKPVGTRLINIKTDEIVKQISPRSGTVDFSPDGKWVTLADNELVEVFSTGSWNVIQSFKVQFGSESAAVTTFSRDGRLLALNTADSEVKVIHLESGRELHSLRSSRLGHINCMAFAPEGKVLVLGTQSENVVNVWNLEELEGTLAKLLISPGNVKNGNEGGHGVLVSGVSVPGNTFSSLLTVVLCILILSLGFAFLIIQRHRQLLEAYVSSEQSSKTKDEKLQMAHAEILHSQKMTALGTLSAGIAHDFNNILSVIRMSNDLVREAETKEEILDNAAEIDQAVVQGRQVVRSLLGYTRESTGEKENYSLQEIAERLVKLLKKEFLREVLVSIQAEPQIPPLYGYPTRVEQILLNLLVNAAEAMRSKGEVCIAVSRTSQEVTPPKLTAKPGVSLVYLRVTDNGPGIAAEHLDRIFEPFFSTKAQGATRGRGLGLSLVYTLAQKEGIGLSVESEIGKGTTFHLAIPVEQKETASMEVLECAQKAQ